MIERSIILWQEGPLTFDVPVSRLSENSVNNAAPAGKPTLLTREELKLQERDAIVAALKHSNGKIFGPGGAAELLGMKPTTLASRISALGMNRKELTR